MSKHCMRMLALTGFVALTLALPTRMVDAHHAVLRFNLEEMTSTADRIFLGRCTEVEETDEVIAQGDMPVTRYTFEVERAIKGKLPKVITVRQMGHPAHRTLGKGGEMTMHGRTATPDTFIHGYAIEHAARWINRLRVERAAPHFG